MEGEVAHWDKVVSTKGKSQMYISLFEKICSSVSEGFGGPSVSAFAENISVQLNGLSNRNSTMPGKGANGSGTISYKSGTPARDILVCLKLNRMQHTPTVASGNVGCMLEV